MKINELIGRFADAKVRIPEYCGKDVKILLPLKVEELVNPAIFEQAEEEIAKFDKVYSDLQNDISNFAKEIDKQTAGKRAERETLKHDKSRIISSIATAYAEGQDGSKLYNRLAKIDSELSQVESFLFEMETLKKYPDSERIIEKSKQVFEAGKQLYKFFINVYQPAEEQLKKQYKDLSLLLRVAEGQLSSYHFSITGLRQNQIKETYARTTPEAANHSRDELERMSLEEIEKALSS